MFIFIADLNRQVCRKLTPQGGRCALITGQVLGCGCVQGTKCTLYNPGAFDKDAFCA